MARVTDPFPIFYDDDGTPLENGMIYVGEPNLDPRTNPVTVYWDEARTITAVQPIRTLGGRPAYQGAPTGIYVSQTSYSISVFNRFGNPIGGDIDASSLVTASEIEALVSTSPILPETGTSYTLALDDANAVVPITNSSAITLTIPNNSAVAIPVGSWVEVHQGGTGQITFSPASGVTLNTRGGFNKTAGQNAIAGLRKMATNTWILTGDIIA